MNKMTFVNYLTKNATPYLVAFGITLGALSACSKVEKRKELSDVIKSESIVANKRHVPRRTTITNQRIGDMTIPVTNTYPEKNTIWFEGDVSFRINSKKLHDSFNIGDSVFVLYKEVHTNFYEDLDGTGNKIRTGREFDGYKFVNAVPKK